MSKIDKLFLENINSVGYEIWGMPGQSDCDFCGKEKSASHSVMLEEYCFCNDCGYILVMYLQERGYKNATYEWYVSYLLEEYANKITGLREHWPNLK
jgi:hypothetical protein